MLLLYVKKCSFIKISKNTLNSADFFRKCFSLRIWLLRYFSIFRDTCWLLRYSALLSKGISLSCSFHDIQFLIRGYAKNRNEIFQ